MKYRIHTHPWMEKEKNIPAGHVIIDESLYLELLRRFGQELPEEEEKWRIKD